MTADPPEDREAHLLQLEALLDRRAAEIDTLKAEAEAEDDPAAKETLATRIAALEAEQQKLRARTGGARTAAAFEDLKTGAENTWADLTKSFKEAKDRWTKK